MGRPAPNEDTTDGDGDGDGGHGKSWKERDERALAMTVRAGYCVGVAMHESSGAEDADRVE